MSNVPGPPGGGNDDRHEPSGNGDEFLDLVARLERLLNENGMRRLLNGLREVADLRCQTLACIYCDQVGSEIWGRLAEILDQVRDSLPEGL
jgi:hypothetical protein